MREKELVKLRKKVYQLLKVNDATNKVSWWNLSDDVVDLIVSERERVIGEIRELLVNDEIMKIGGSALTQTIDGLLQDYLKK